MYIPLELYVFTLWMLACGGVSLNLYVFTLWMLACGGVRLMVERRKG